MTDSKDPVGGPAQRPDTDATGELIQTDPFANSARSAITEVPDVATSSLAPSADATDSAAQLAWLHQELDQQLSAYRHRRKRDKRKAFVLQMATVTLSATITVLLGLRTVGTTQQRLADVALALGAIITVLAAAEAFFTHRGLWILRTHTVRRLENLARHLDYQQTRRVGHALEPAIVDRYAAELDDILNEDQTRWQQLRATTPEIRNPETPNNASGSSRETR